MSNPSVTAVISVNDKASPRLRELMELSQKLNRVAKDLNNQGGDRYANSLRHATAAAREHISTMERLHKVQHAVMGTVAGVATFKALQIAKHAVADYIPYERDVRYQRAIQGFSNADMALLEKQRVDAAAIYGLKPEDTLHAQQAFVTRNFNAAITEAGTKQAIILSKALNVSAEQSAKIVEGLTFGQGIHLHSPDDARREIAKSTDVAALAAKAGAMSPDDLTLFSKYGIGMASAAKISPEQAFAIGMTLKRANVGGDESGVFMRQMSARLLAPTKQAFEAFAHMGIDYNQYATQGNVSPDAIDASLRRRYGKGLSDEGKASLGKAFEDGDALATREAFTGAITTAIEAAGEKLSRTDQKHLIDTALRQYDLAKGGLRGGDLLNDILSKATPRDLQALVGDKQGGRAVMLLNAVEQYREYVDKLSHAEGYASKIANERLEGLAAATDRLMASFDMASKQLVKANEGWLTPAAEVAAKAAGVVASLDSSSRVALSASVGLGALAGLSAAGATVASLVASFGGLTVNANLAATSLARIAAGGAVGTAAGAAGAGVGAATAGAAGFTASRVAAGLAIASRFAGWAGVAVLGYQAMNAVSGAEPNPEADSNYARWKWDNALHADERRSRQNAMSSFISGYTSLPVQPSEQRLSTLKALGLSDDQVTDNSNPALASGRVSVKGGGAAFGDVNVSGTVTGIAELHQNLQIEVKPSRYFESLVQRAEAISGMALNGYLGTEGHGPGDNSIKTPTPLGIQ